MSRVDHVTQQQRVAATPALSAWVSANAGSGKTKVLIDRVARLLLDGAKPDEILCITYTKAAASEMQQRLFKRLGEWSVLSDEKLAEDLRELFGDKGEHFSGEDLKQARMLFARALETPGGLRIETVHACSGRILRRFPLEAGVPARFTELDDQETASLLQSGLDTAMAEVLALRNGHALRLDLIDAVGGRGLSGLLPAVQGNARELRELFQRFPSHDERYDALSEHLGIPAQTASEVVDGVLEQDAIKEALRATIAEMADASSSTDVKLRDLAVLLSGQSSSEVKLDAARALILTQSGYRKKLYNKAYNGTSIERLWEPETGEVWQAFIDLFETCALVDLRDKTLACLAFAQPILKAYEHAKARRAGLDFDDLIQRTRHLFKSPGLAEWVLYKIDGGLSHILLDEAQDTSPEQWDIVNAIIAEFITSESPTGKPRTQFVVGDEKQSIYSFQGADTAKFQTERQAFAARQADEQDHRFELPEIAMSFRSTPDVLGFVDKLFNTAAVDDGTPAFSTEPPPGSQVLRHDAYREDERGQVELWPLERKDQSDAGSRAWDAPLDMETEASAEAKLAKRIATWISAGLQDSSLTVWEKKKVRRASPGDILILVRSRGPLFRAILKALKQEGLPVAGADRINLLDQLAVQDVLNLVRFALCQDDDLTLAEVLKGPFIGWVDDNDARLMKLAVGRGSTSLWERLCRSEDPAAQQAVDALRPVMAARSGGIASFLSDALNRPWPHTHLTGWAMVFARYGEMVRDPLDVLMSRASALQPETNAGLQVALGALEALDLDLKRELSGPAEEIRVMTVHGAKGLEAPIVILPDTTSAPTRGLSGDLVVDDEGWPLWAGSKGSGGSVIEAFREAHKAKEQAESNRLLYVALTRAQDHLVICGAEKGRGEKGYTENSWYDLCLRTAIQEADLEAGEAIEDVVLMGEGVPPADSASTQSTSRPKTETVLPDWLTQDVADVRSTTQKRVRAPSKLLSGETPVIPPFGKGHENRFQRGRLIHALLQILPELPKTQREERAVAYLSQCLRADQGELFEDILEATFKVLSAPELEGVFAQGGRSEVPIIGSGPNLPPGVIINGRVDRFHLTDSHVHIIDYKTDRPPPKTESDVDLPYLAQMAAYYDVLKSTYPEHQVHCALLWTDGPRFMRLSESAMLAALTKAR